MSTKIDRSWSLEKRITPRLIITIIGYVAISVVWVTMTEVRLGNIEQKVEKALSDNPTILERITVIEQNLKFHTITLGRIERALEKK